MAAPAAGLAAILLVVPCRAEIPAGAPVEAPVQVPERASDPALALASPAATRCPQHFLDGRPPVLTNPKLAAATRPLCYSGYAVLHSGVSRTPVWAAEHLTRARIEAARDGQRSNDFHPDPALPEAERSELGDYARSGFDRGHMAPFGDMPDPVSQEESFSLANMIPQDPNDNRHLWEGIEHVVRGLALEDGEVDVVTGPIFSGENLRALNGRVLVPTQIFKAVYDAARGGAAAYLVENAPGDAYRVVSIAELRMLAGIDPFPGLAPDVEARAIALPEPRPYRTRREEDGDPSAPPHRGARRDPGGGGQDGGFVDGILRSIERMGRE